jgi:hypothetical protein
MTILSLKRNTSLNQINRAMKRYILILIVIFATSCSDNTELKVDLKGYTLGEIYDGEKNFETTLGEIEGIMKIRTLDDGRIYYVEFNTSEPIIPEQLNNLLKGLHKKYNITYEKVSGDDFGQEGEYEKIQDGIRYNLVFTFAGFTRPHNHLLRDVYIAISHIGLTNLAYDEEDSKKTFYNDF